MVDANEPLVAARDAYRQRNWDVARERFDEARARGELRADDLSMLADAAWWLGQVEESIDAGAAAYRAHLDAGQVRPAAWAAIGVAVNHFLRGEEAPGAGWIERAAGLLADHPDCAEAG